MNPLTLQFPGGPVDATTFQPLQGPTSRSVPWTDPLADVVFPALAIASRVSVLADRHETIIADELELAQQERWQQRACELLDEASAIESELHALGAIKLLGIAWWQREARLELDDEVQTTLHTIEAAQFADDAEAFDRSMSVNRGRS